MNVLDQEFHLIFLKKSVHAPIVAHVLQSPGVIDCREFCVGVTLCSLVSGPEKVRTVFDLFDLDRDGYLSAPELHTLLTTAVASTAQISTDG